MAKPAIIATTPTAKRRNPPPGAVPAAPNPILAALIPPGLLPYIAAISPAFNGAPASTACTSTADIVCKAVVSRIAMHREPEPAVSREDNACNACDK